MLMFLGLFGVLVAGVAADALLSLNDRSDDADEDADFPDDGEGQTGGPGLLNDDPAPEGNTADGNASPDSGDGFALSDDLPRPDPAALDIRGSDAGEVLSGGLADDQIYGQGGNDLIDGRASDDMIDAGSGDDAVWAGEGNDTVYGGAGRDTLDGQTGDDLLIGGEGNDSLSGASGHDVLYGDAGADTVLGGEGNDLLFGGDGADWLAGGYGNDMLAGGAGGDILDGGAGDDWLSGLDGDADDLATDYLNGGAGNDTLVLGAGDHASGGEGEDDFVLKDWLTEGGVAHISDYEADRDQLIIMYDPIAHPDPVLSLEMSADGARSTILLDGAPVATVQGSPVQLADIRLNAA